MAPQAIINWAVYNSLPPEEAEYQLAHINDSKIGSTATAYIICVPIGVLAVIMRFVSRRIGRTAYGADDWTVVVGMVTYGFFMKRAGVLTCLMIDPIHCRLCLVFIGYVQFHSK